ncbi:trafficking protein particle complex subunit 11-like [Acanthaster planci]|uniref:Trafficking protein particle complex subunit 11 n=1 Tax=Acanthaster planci TaxID=133434 RepID=A0A8B7ZFU9_ACAPL|nr:trafficking protein particle complex subunit 11-like [Acanthaster planci]XP_022103871.1 trafficking protein particle complex subunit 11-like [Acanthaster planci]XP_022103872.1 trafficking protein particle complex subunit 11-like [Acanthaster planci]
MSTESGADPLGAQPDASKAQPTVTAKQPSTSLSTTPVPTSAKYATGPGDLPSELMCRPLGLVVLTGLNTTYNAVHRAIWDSFSANRRPDRVPLYFKAWPADHEYPKCRSKQRTSYEWYIPKGIIKSSWMKKHLQEVPALVVVFFDLDWDENMWKERQMECATRVEVVRTSLHGRGTRVAVVLIQKNAPLPPGEDVIAAERAAALCAACELSAKSLFVLPCVDHLLGYTIRLENAFYELTQGYYHTEARRVKAHREFLNRTTHQLLFVRHAFKFAFFSELKQDTHGALKQYKAAYTHLTELRAHDTNMLEIKTIAGFINYKVCRLSFFHNTPLDAISQFRKHVDLFKNKIGCHELAFEHSAWMSKQFSIFGELFEEAIKLGLTAIQTQHPGFYYQQAANHAIARKQLCRGLCHAATAMPASNPLEDADSLEFFGQRPWRQGHQSIDPPDPQMEREGILALQYLESQVDHSWIIIPLLSSAVAQFKKYKSARMKRYLMVQMGEEYYHAKDYSKALTLLGRVTWDYRLERWWPLLTSILGTSLRCAYLVASIEEYVTICLELLGRYSQSSPEERTRVQMNLIRVLSNNSPEPEPGCAPDAVEQARHLWKTMCSPQSTPKAFRVEMRNLVPFVECKARFTSPRFAADELVSLEVCLRSSCQFPIQFSKLAVQLSNQAYNAQCIITDGRPLSYVEGVTPTADLESHGNLYLMPGKVKQHKFKFAVLPEDVGRKLEISSICLSLGDEANARCAVLYWQGGGADAASLMNIHEVVTYTRGPPKPDQLVWERINIEQTTSVHPRPARVHIELDHQPPCLVNEYYCMKVAITNNEEEAITQPTMSVGLQEGQDASLEKSTEISLDPDAFLKTTCPGRIKNIALGTMKQSNKVEKTVYMRCTQLGSRVISVRVVYNVEVKIASSDRLQPVSCTCYQEQSVSLQSILPFDVSIHLTSLKFKPIDYVNSGRSFLLMTDIRCTSPWPVAISNSTLKLKDGVRPTDSLESQISNVVLKNEEHASECVCVQAPSHPDSGLIALGSCELEWKRDSINDNLPPVKTILPLPEVSIQPLPLSIETDIPAFGVVRSPLLVKFTISNQTSVVQAIEASVQASEAFMYSGHKLVFFRILPSSSQTLSYNLYPLIAGYVQLPELQLTIPQAPTMTKDIVATMLPSHIYIKPQGKTT